MLCDPNMQTLPAAGRLIIRIDRKQPTGDATSVIDLLASFQRLDDAGLSAIRPASPLLRRTGSRKGSAASEREIEYAAEHVKSDHMERADCNEKHDAGNESKLDRHHPRVVSCMLGIGSRASHSSHVLS
jgi:hypothetical protein